MFKNLDPAALGGEVHQSEIIELALTYGFRAIDLNIVDFAARVKLHGMTYARRLLASAKLRVGTCALPSNWDVDGAAFEPQLEQFAEYARLAAELGCTRMLCTVAPAGDNRPYHENFEFHKRRFAEICRLLEPAGVQLGVGIRAAEGIRKGRAFQFIRDLDALLLLLNMVSASNLGVVVDVWDLWLSGASVDTIRGIPVRQIVAVELADLPADVPLAEIAESQRLLPGATGKIDCAAVLNALSEMGYEGPVTIKADRSAYESTRRDRMVKQAAEILDKLWKAARLTPDGKWMPAAT